MVKGIADWGTGELTDDTRRAASEAAATFIVHALTVGALPLVWEKSLPVLLNHAYASYALVIFITAAIFAYFSLFHFGLNPGQLIYVGAYFLVGIPIFFVLWREGTGLRRA